MNLSLKHFMNVTHMVIPRVYIQSSTHFPPLVHASMHPMKTSGQSQQGASIFQQFKNTPIYKKNMLYTSFHLKSIHIYRWHLKNVALCKFASAHPPLGSASVLHKFLTWLHLFHCSAKTDEENWRRQQFASTLNSHLH